mmetsp:Transcript_83004/g.231662  ORF Transcript_83004/g.231662 Transcript_83004/m.231662 type:complete len:303 (-) Transcript_83004:72-980(-)
MRPLLAPPVMEEPARLSRSLLSMLWGRRPPLSLRVMPRGSRSLCATRMFFLMAALHRESAANFCSNDAGAQSWSKGASASPWSEQSCSSRRAAASKIALSASIRVDGESRPNSTKSPPAAIKPGTMAPFCSRRPRCNAASASARKSANWLPPPPTTSNARRTDMPSAVLFAPTPRNAAWQAARATYASWARKTPKMSSTSSAFGMSRRGAEGASLSARSHRTVEPSVSTSPTRPASGKKKPSEALAMRKNTSGALAGKTSRKCMATLRRSAATVSSLPHNTTKRVSSASVRNCTNSFIAIGG